VMGEAVQLTDRHRQILALLGSGCTRNSLGERLWPGMEPGRQRNNLNVQLNSLRKVLEPWGVSTFIHQDGLARFHSDLAELRAALGARDAARSFELYGGALCAGD